VPSTFVRGKDWSCKVAVPKDHLAGRRRRNRRRRR